MRYFWLSIWVLLLTACSTTKIEQPAAAQSVSQPTQWDASAYLSQSIQVTLQGGAADFHNVIGFSQYQPIQVTLTPDQRVTKTLQESKDHFFDANASVTFYYHKGVLSVDGQPGEQFRINAAWVQGQTYQSINTYGYANLRGATLKVRILP